MRSHSTITRALATAALALALLALALLAGCGTNASRDAGIATAGGAAKDGGSPSPGISKKPSVSKNPQDAMLQFARCMRENGVNVPDPSAGGPIRIGPPDDGAQSKSVFEKARKACEQYLPGIGGDGDGASDAKMQDRMLKFARCMREHGVDMPDPAFKGGGGSFRIPGDPESDTFKAAQQARKQYFGPPPDGGADAAAGAA